jgi:hypothetical protein
VTVAKEIECKDAFENVGAQISGNYTEGGLFGRILANKTLRI